LFFEVAARPLACQGFLKEKIEKSLRKLKLAPTSIQISQVLVAAGFSLRRFFKRKNQKILTQAKACAYLKTKKSWIWVAARPLACEGFQKPKFKISRKLKLAATAKIQNQNLLFW
jgi:hypothetical protein